MDMRVFSIILLVALFSNSYDLFAAEPDSSSTENDTTAVTLEDVVVKADRMIQKDDHIVMHLSDDNRSFGTNALDAISSMPLFVTSLNDTKLTSYDRSNVYILINNVPSSGMDLRSYRAEDIKKIEYYSVTPAQYMGLTNGPVLNVVTKRRYDRMYTGYFNAMNAVTTGLGTNQASLSYTDSMSQVRLNYYMAYSNEKDLYTMTEYSDGTDKKSLYNGNRTYRSENHNINATYQYFRGPHLFSAKANFTLNPSTENEIRVGEITYGGLEYTGTGFHRLKNTLLTGSLKLYYHYQMKNGRALIFNLTNSYGRSTSESSQDMSSDNSLELNYGYNISSSTRNNPYLLRAMAHYITSLWGKPVLVGIQYDYDNLRQTNSGNTQILYSHSAHPTANMRFQFKQIKLSPTIGASYLYQNLGNKSSSEFNPYIRLSAEWRGTGSLNGVMTQLTCLSQILKPSLSYLTDSESYRDQWIVYKGNPLLKGSYLLDTKLSLGYFSQTNDNNISLSFSSIYMSNPYYFTTIVRADDGKVYFMPQNIGAFWTSNLLLRGAISPFKWLRISPFVMLITNDYTTPSQDINHSHIYAGVELACRLKNLTIIGSAYMPSKGFEGDLRSKSSQKYVLQAQYKLKNWSLGALYQYAGKDVRTWSDIGSFSYRNNQDLRPLQNLVQISATYSFSIGKMRQRRLLLEDNNAIDDGLTKYNRTVKPE